VKNNDRYALTSPVKGGDQWWSITDTNLNFQVVSISAKLRNAEKIVRQILADLLKAEGLEEEPIATTQGDGTL
jgi:hypothetical protein